MTEVYSTEQLVQILAAEQRSCMNGQRLTLSARVSGVNPIIDQFINAEGIQKFTAYLDFRAAVHRYQREHQVSGIIWREITIRGRTLLYPQVDEQLIALDRDRDTLKAAKTDVLAFWLEQSAGMDLYLAIDQGREYQALTPAKVQGLACKTEWATLTKREQGNFFQLVLRLGWGEPGQSLYQRGWPEAGSELIYAVYPGDAPIP